MVQFRQWLSLLRIKQYTKNGFVLAPLFFSFSFLNQHALLISLYGFVVFSIAASAVYVFNDILDKSEDAAHPVKCRRPLASGIISARSALVAGIILAGIAVSASLVIDTGFGCIIITYIIINCLYSL